MRWSLFTLILSLCFATAWSLAQADPQDDEAESAAIAAESEAEVESDFEVRAEREQEASVGKEHERFEETDALEEEARKLQEEARKLREQFQRDPLAREIAEFEVSRRVLDVEMRELEAKRAEMERLFRRQQTEFEKAISDLEKARQRIRANMEVKIRSIQLLQAQQHDRQRQPRGPALKSRHPHPATLPHAPPMRADLHVALQKAVEDLRAEIAALRDEVAELRSQVEER